jgi:2-methylcitrate dehydratase PrpD
MDSSALTSPKRWQPHTRRASGYPSAVSARQPAPAPATETPLERPWRLRIDAGADRVCNIPHPTTGLEAKFSLRQTIAMALASIDTAALGSYNEAVTQLPQIRALRDKITIDFQPSWSHSRAELTIQLADQTTRTATADTGIPAADLANQRRSLETKYTGLVTPILGSPATGRLHSLLSQLAQLNDISELTRTARLP